MESKDTKKSFGIKRVEKSIINSVNGLKAAYKNEQSVYIHLVFSFLLICLSFILDITLIEWLVIIAIIGVTLSIELINTSIESTVDLVTGDYHLLAKMAKDTASAAEFILALTGAIISLIIFLPRLISLF